MIRPAFDDQDEKPLDPAVEKVRRKLVRFVAINLGLLFVALMAVVAAVVYKTRGAPGPAVPMSEITIPAGSGMIEADIALPAGSSIVSQAVSGNRITLDVALPGGQRSIFLYDMAEKRMIGRFSITFQ